MKEIRSVGKEEFLVKPLLRDATKRNLHVAIEALLDVGSFIISREGLVLSLQLPRGRKEARRTWSDWH